MLAAGASLAGLLAEGLYEREAAGYAAQLQGHDAFSLFVAVPLVLGAMVLASRSRLAWLVWVGALIYFAYSFATYAFAVHFNALFVVYAVSLGLALYGLIGALAGVDRQALRSSFGGRTPAFAVSRYLIFFGGAFYAFWLTQVLPSSFDGTLPEAVADDRLLTYPIHVIDLAVYLPAFVIAGLLLARGDALGYTLSAPLLTSAVLIQAALAARVVGAIAGDHPYETPELIVLLGFAALTLGVLVWFLRGARAS